MAERVQSQDLCLALDDALSPRFGRAGAVREVQRKPLSRASTFAAERINAIFRDGTTLVVFFKDLFHTARGRAASVSRLERGYRELTVYRRVLDGRPFDTPQLHGSLWDPEHARCWLFLEWIPGQTLSQATRLDVWRTAARWAARFHARSRAISLADLACLPRYDQLGYGVRADLLRARLPDATPSDRRLIEESLSRYEGLGSRLAQLSQSVIHGELFPANIIVRRDVPGSADGTVAIIDWETAAIGPSYLDIVSLTSGHEPGMRDDLLGAYFEECQAAGGGLEWARFREDVEIVEFVHVMKWLSWFARRKGPGRRRWVRWIEELRRIASEPSRMI
jgi:aminoglycoside/choline kinase family phosphotransferase